MRRRAILILCILEVGLIVAQLLLVRLGSSAAENAGRKADSLARDIRTLEDPELTALVDMTCIDYRPMPWKRDGILDIPLDNVVIPQTDGKHMLPRDQKADHDFSYDRLLSGDVNERLARGVIEHQSSMALTALDSINIEAGEEGQQIDVHDMELWKNNEYVFDFRGALEQVFTLKKEFADIVSVAPRSISRGIPMSLASIVRLRTLGRYAQFAGLAQSLAIVNFVVLVGAVTGRRYSRRRKAAAEQV